MLGMESDGVNIKMIQWLKIGVFAQIFAYGFWESWSAKDAVVRARTSLKPDWTACCGYIIL